MSEDSEAKLAADRLLVLLVAAMELGLEPPWRIPEKLSADQSITLSHFRSLCAAGRHSLCSKSYALADLQLRAARATLESLRWQWAEPGGGHPLDDYWDPVWESLADFGAKIEALRIKENQHPWIRTHESPSRNASRPPD